MTGIRSKCHARKRSGEFIEMSTAYAKDTAHVRKQFETSAEQTQHLTTLAQKSDN